MSSLFSSHEKSLEALGNLLKTKREISGLTRRDVVVKTKIPLDQLEAIEDGRLSSLPPVFAKGFLRAYANELGLDAEAVLEDYRQLTKGSQQNEAANKSTVLSNKYVESSVGPSPWRTGPRALVALVLIVAAAGISLWLWPGLRTSAVELVPFLAHLPGFEAPAPGEEQPSEDNLLAQDPFAMPLPEATDAEAAEMAQAPEPLEVQSVGGALSPPPWAGQASATPAEPAAPGGTLLLASQKDRVWIQVIVDGGQPQYFLLNSGQKVIWRAEDHIIVTAGQAGSLLVNWNGQDLGPLGDRPVVERRFPQG